MATEAKRLLFDVMPTSLKYLKMYTNNVQRKRGNATDSESFYYYGLSLKIRRNDAAKNYTHVVEKIIVPFAKT